MIHSITKVVSVILKLSGSMSLHKIIAITYNSSGFTSMKEQRQPKNEQYVTECILRSIEKKNIRSEKSRSLCSNLEDPNNIQ